MSRAYQYRILWNNGPQTFHPTSPESCRLNEGFEFRSLAQWLIWNCRSILLWPAYFFEPYLMNFLHWFPRTDDLDSRTPDCHICDTPVIPPVFHQNESSMTICGRRFVLKKSLFSFSRIRLYLRRFSITSSGLFLRLTSRSENTSFLCLFSFPIRTVTLWTHCRKLGFSRHPFVIASLAFVCVNLNGFHVTWSIL